MLHVSVHWKPGYKHHFTAFSVQLVYFHFLLLLLWVWILTPVSVSGLIRAINVEIPQIKHKHQEVAEVAAAPLSPIKSPANLFARVFTLRGLNWALHYSGWTGGIQGFLSVTLLLIKFIAAFSIDFKAKQKTTLLCFGYLWCKTFAIGASQPTLPCGCSWVSATKMSHCHPFVTFLGSHLSDAKGSILLTVPSCWGLLGMLSMSLFPLCFLIQFKCN